MLVLGHTYISFVALCVLLLVIIFFGLCICFSDVMDLFFIMDDLL